jgi:hypothetical protein
MQMTEGDVVFNLANFSVGADSVKQIKGMAELNANQYRTLLDHLNRFDRIELRQMYHATVNNFGKLHALSSFYAQLFRQSRDRKQIDIRKAGFEYTTCLLNWMNSVKIFVDHELARYARLYGKKSVELSTFKAATRQEFDENLGYRFMYKLRNYATHCGLPIGSVTLGSGPDRSSQTISFSLNRDSLLNDFNQWGPIVKSDLEQMAEDFEIFPLVRECMDSIHSIMKTVLSIDLNAAKAVAIELKRELDSLDPDNLCNALIRWERFSSGKIAISPKFYSMEMISQVIEATSVNAIISEPLTEDANLDRFADLPTLPPSTVELQRRGIDVLSIWLQEHGSSPAFFQHLNAIISHDNGDFRPALVGTVLMGATFLTTASLASGMSAEELLADLSDANDAMVRRNNDDIDE